MSLIRVTDPATYRLEENIDPSGQAHVLTFDLGTPLNLVRLKVGLVVNEIKYDTWYTVAWSVDNVVWAVLGTQWADNQFHIPRDWEVFDAGLHQIIYIKLSCGYDAGSNNGILDLYDVFVEGYDFIPDSIRVIEEAVELNVGLTGFTGYNSSAIGLTTWVFPHIVEQTFGSVDPEPEPPTSTNFITGNVKKLGLPFEANVVAVSVELEPKVLGQTVSDAITGDYAIDVYPHTSEVMVYVAPQYGKAFSPELFMSTGHVLHPPVPNKYIYVAQNDGVLSLFEPVWATSGLVISGEVTLKVEPLHRPLMNGFIKPTVTPI